MHGDLVANIQSLSAIQPNEEFRHELENEESEIKEDLKRSQMTLSVEEILERREQWIEEACAKGERSPAWRLKEQALLSKFRALLANPVVSFAEDTEEKAVSTTDE